MTISIVQSKVLSSSAWSGSFTGNVTAGNTVFLFAYQYQTASGSSMSSSAPLFNGSSVSGAVEFVTGQSGTGGNDVYGAIWMLPNLAGGAASCALTNTGGIVDTNVGLIGIEAAGLGTAPVLDTASPNPKTTGGTTVSPSSGASGNIVSSPDLILGLAVEFGVGLTLPGGAWSGLQTTSGFTAAGWQIATSSGSAYTYSGTGTGANWFAGVAAVAVTPAAQAGRSLIVPQAVKRSYFY